MTAPRPITMLIAALGGEGGGVLTDWIVGAAARAGFPVQSTSIPGVAQRTGATTYYIEILPVPAATLGGRRPVLALTPGVGDIDIVVASELMEAGRTIANGFVTPDRTSLIASTSRFYAMDEKIAMGDGRYDQDKLDRGHHRARAAAPAARHGALAKQSGAMINAVMLGAIAGTGRLPITAEQLEAAIRADGKAVDANLRGFRAGLDAARAKVQPAEARRARKSTPPPTRRRSKQEVAGTFPARRSDRASKACAGSRPIRASPTRGFISTGSGPSSQPTKPPARKASCCARPRGISRCACRSRT